MKQYVIVVAGGKGSRMGADIPKQFLLLNGKAIILHTLEKFTQALPDAVLVLVLPEREIPRWKDISKGTLYENLTIAKGGESRFESVKSGLSYIKEDGLVGIHDAVRPFVSSETIKRVFDSASKHAAAIPVVDLKESIRKLENGKSVTQKREEYRLVQTPQCFRSQLLHEAYKQEYHPLFTDDASVVERAGGQIHLVEGNYENIKITTPEDLKIAMVFLHSR